MAWPQPSPGKTVKKLGYYSAVKNPGDPTPPTHQSKKEKTIEINNVKIYRSRLPPYYAHTAKMMSSRPLLLILAIIVFFVVGFQWVLLEQRKTRDSVTLSVTKSNNLRQTWNLELEDRLTKKDEELKQLKQMWTKFKTNFQKNQLELQDRLTKKHLSMNDNIASTAQAIVAKMFAINDNINNINTVVGASAAEGANGQIATKRYVNNSKSSTINNRKSLILVQEKKTNLQNEKLPTYEGDNKDIHLFYQEIEGNIVPESNGHHWKTPYPANPLFDCPQNVVDRYAETSKPLPSRHWHGQYGEDKWAWKHFFHDDKGKHDMRFVELGALDGLTYSNSYFYDVEMGWGGVLIEGTTPNYVDLENNRNNTSVETLHIAICSNRKVFHMRGSGPMGAKEGTYNGGQGDHSHRTTVLCLPMHEVLEMTDLKHIDLYSIDVEGAELDVITSHNFNKIPAHLLIIEARPHDENKEGSLTNAKVRRAVWARGFCRWPHEVGHNNEAWINPKWNKKTSKN